jgi:D-alanyl-lipoteichoic acid acyltransferase DltB (MBOAT superfamily)
MLFNSPEFIFVFLPITFIVFFACARLNRTLAIAWLCVASFVFYGYWNPANLPILAVSIVFNYAVGSAIIRLRRGKRSRLPGLFLAAGVAGDLALLGYFKYTDFLVTTFNQIVGGNAPLQHIELPLGISFFTFTQIAYLVDCLRGEAREYNPIRYGLFVTYFPHLIAGPILHHKEMIPQFSESRIFRPSSYYLMAGIAMFSIGLFKKVWLADGVAPIADGVFAVAQSGAVSPATAWAGALAYAMQIYFDFSGYSDMAIGASFMVGVRLPANFYSPYKATSIIDFWRRWHMTLSRFLRDYLYFPLGGNRKGPTRRYVNLLITMALGGLWHGAGWAFLLWGLLHGVYLVINHAWRHQKKRMDLDTSGLPWRLAAAALTFVAVVVAWVFFRSPDLATALTMLGAMAGGGTATVAALKAGDAALIAILMLVAFVAPNSLQIMREANMALGVPESAGDGSTVWKPSAAWGVATGLATATAIFGVLLAIGDEAKFLYFQF